ncbi:hypothetical protein CgunFtcFv8_004699 [Champsocephalus gunnari]|uniref:Uncharacterized protein n=1 Tax=Champsocephalus gunnari TaxID=52237 RepID=A0AAN8E0X6_CHAGU|nr:hypothetical protein CgunFtcFv8_004699 [Champsocephalus gunnari]
MWRFLLHISREAPLTSSGSSKAAAGSRWESPTLRTALQGVHISVDQARAGSDVKIAACQAITKHSTNQR